PDSGMAPEALVRFRRMAGYQPISGEQQHEPDYGLVDVARKSNRSTKERERHGRRSERPEEAPREASGPVEFDRRDGADQHVQRQRGRLHEHRLDADER